jgi:hypothetical protein
LENALRYYDVLKNYVTTDFGATDFFRYMEPLSKIPKENFAFYTLPGIGEDSWVNGFHEWFFRANLARAYEIAEEIFRNYDLPEEAEEYYEVVVQEQDVKKLRIRVLNGGDVVGLAERTRNRLREEGYTVTGLGDHRGTRTSHTRIFTRYEADVSELSRFFGSGVTFEVSSGMTGSDVDILIILGEGESG